MLSILSLHGFFTSQQSAYLGKENFLLVYAYFEYAIEWILPIRNNAQNILSAIIFTSISPIADRKIKRSMYISEAVARRCSVKKMFPEIWQNWQKNTCVRASFWRVSLLIK